MRVTLLIVVGAAAGIAVRPVVAGPDWRMFAGSPGRTSLADSGPASIGAPTWVFSSDGQGNAITFMGQSGPVVTRDLVLVIGSITPAQQTRQWKLFAVDRRTGLPAWAAPLPAPSLDSWSSPALDTEHNSVLVASGAFVTAFDLASGALRWQSALSMPVVNASPLVTSGPALMGLGIAQRAFVTEYDGFGTQGRLTCLNVSPFQARLNPFQPGEIVWSVLIGGSSGNTPAFDRGVVYVSSTGDYGAGPGRIFAFPAAATTEPQPLWTFENPSGEGFFSGVCVSRPLGTIKRYLYASSYAFYGGTTSANLVKVDAATGAMIWSAPCNRTSATPIPLPDGRVLVSGGVRGYGTVPTLQLFADQGSSVLPLWDSALDTWADANHNGVMDLGEFLLLGGWSHQPVAVLTPDSRTLYCGAVPTNPNSTGACNDLYAIDLDKLPFAPGQPLNGYLAQHSVGAGSTPAVADSNLYTIGPGGLCAFGPPPPRCDVNGDCLVDIEDVYWWQEGRGERDVNLDGVVTSADGTVLVASVRYGENEDMAAGRQP